MLLLLMSLLYSYFIAFNGFIYNIGVFFSTGLIWQFKMAGSSSETGNCNCLYKRHYLSDLLAAHDFIVFLGFGF